MDEVVLVGIGGTEVTKLRVILLFQEPLYLTTVHTPLIAWWYLCAIDSYCTLAVVHATPRLGDIRQKVLTFNDYFLRSCHIFNTLNYKL